MKAQHSEATFFTSLLPSTLERPECVEAGLMLLCLKQRGQEGGQQSDDVVQSRRRFTQRRPSAKRVPLRLLAEIVCKRLRQGNRHAVGKGGAAAREGGRDGSAQDFSLEGEQPCQRPQIVEVFHPTVA